MLLGAWLLLLLARVVLCGSALAANQCAQNAKVNRCEQYNQSPHALHACVQVRVCTRHLCAAHAPYQHDAQADAADLARLFSAAQEVGGQGEAAAGDWCHSLEGCAVLQA